MNEQEVTRALTKSGIKKVERVDYPQHFLLQAPELTSSIKGGLIFYFDDGKVLTRIYSNAKNISIKTKPSLEAGMPLSDFVKALGEVKDIELLPNKNNRSTSFDLGDFRLEAISDTISGGVLAWSITKR